MAISNVPTFRPANPADILSFEQAVAAVITVARDDLKLPVVDQVNLNLYKNSLSFAVYGFGYTTLPIDVVNATATAIGSTIHIDLQKTQGYLWPGLVNVLAHEYAHTIHYSLAGREFSRSNWFSEGFAEWVSAKVLDVLGWQEYGLSRYRVYQELFRHQELLPSDNLVDWNSLRAKPKGSIRTYSVGFGLVDRLIQMRGLSAMMEYLRSGDFEHSFGVSQKAFIEAFKEYVGSINPGQPASVIIPRPDWKVGNQWTYVETRPGFTTKITEEVVTETMVWGVPCFLVRIGDETHFYTKPTLSLIAIAKDGNLTSRNSKPDRIFFWPLETGMEWQNSFIRRDFEKGFARRINYMMVAANSEQVTVPAGTFQAVKIQAYGYETGRLVAEYWYCHTVKWLVKSRTFRRNEGYIERELVRFVDL